VPLGSLERHVTDKMTPKAPITNTKEERREELQRLAAMPNGIDKLCLILTGNVFPFQQLPIEALMIDTILAHEYPERS
jgi:hypothetical protein